MIRLGLTGDVMLGRFVDRYVLGVAGMRPDYVWGDLLPLFRQMNLRLINLECVIAASGSPWALTPKVFHFRARPRAVTALRDAGIDFAGLANNHILDFDAGAMAECLTRLDEVGIGHAGAGRTLEQAAAPATLASGAFQCAVIALTDNEPEWAAAAGRPGVNFVDYTEEGLSGPYFARIQTALAGVRGKVDLVIVCAHVGPNWGTPSPSIRALARQLIDLGADLYWGHSNHTVQGIELYRGRPILYSCGDFVDDYAVDPEERNDLSFFFEVTIAGGRVKGIRLHPVRIDRLQVARAMGADAEWICRQMERRCASMGTNTEREDNALRVDVPLP